MRFLSNPKTVEQYKSMFNRLIKYYNEFLNSKDLDIVFDNGWEGVNEFPISFCDDEEDLEEFIKNVSNKYVRNDIIESILKNIRAVESFTIYRHCIDMISISKVQLPVVIKLRDFTYKIFNDYVNDNEALDMGIELDNTGPYSFLTYKTDLNHFLDIAKTNRKYKAIADYSWSGKTIGFIHKELSELEHEIGENLLHGFDEDNYLNAYKRRNDETPYLDLKDGFTWYILEGNTHPFESYIGSRPMGRGNHCGADGNADVFFSLRYVDYDIYNRGAFVSVATFACKRIKTYNKKTPFIYILGQAKGSANNPLPPEHWVRAMKLLVRPEFVSFSIGPYKPEVDFSPYWLQDKYLSDTDTKEYEDELSDNLNFKISASEWKDYKALADSFFKLKDNWDNFIPSLSKFGIKEIGKYRKSDLNCKDISFNEDGVVLTYYGFLDMLNSVKKHWGRNGGKFENFVDNFDDYYSDYSYPYNEIDEKEFLREIKDIDENIYKIVIQCMEEEELSIFEAYEEDLDTPCGQILKWVGEAIISANDTGWEVGEQNSRYEAYSRDFDGISVGNDHFDEIAKIDKLSDGDWTVTFNIGALDYYGLDSIPYVSDDQFVSIINNTEWYVDYDDDAMRERLSEELPSLENIKKIVGDK